MNDMSYIKLKLELKLKKQPKDFDLQKGTTSKRAVNRSSRKARCGERLETGRFQRTRESGDDLVRNLSEQRARALERSAQLSE
ncbi:MAG: hypothetical protein AB7E31_03735 [Desulfitobacterium sp.]